MKNVIIAIISFALLLGLSGCMHHGDHLPDGHSHPDSYYGASYFGYPWFYPWGFFSFRYNYYTPYRVDKHRHPPYQHPQDSKRQDVYKKRYGQRPPDPPMRQKEDDFRGRPQPQKDRGRHGGRN